MWPATKNAHSRPSEIDWKYGDPIAESPSRKTGALASGWSMPDCAPEAARRVPRAVDVERDPDDLEVADELAVRLLLDLVDEPVHRGRDAWEVVAQPGAVE